MGTRNGNNGQCGIPHSCEALVPVAGGRLPATLDDCTALMQAAKVAENIPGAVRCIAIARARLLFGDDRTADWIMWVCDNWSGIGSKSEVYHKRAIGDLLLRELEGVWYTTLLQLSQDKLLALTRLPAKLFAPFMDKANPLNQTRDQVRKRVSAALGETAREQRAAPATKPTTQMDFFSALYGGPDDEDLAEMYKRIQVAARDVTPPQAFRGTAKALSAVDVLIPRLTQARLLMVATNLEEEAQRARKLAAEQHADDNEDGEEQ